MARWILCAVRVPRFALGHQLQSLPSKNKVKASTVLVQTISAAIDVGSDDK
jgi:hypothetical protein